MLLTGPVGDVNAEPVGSRFEEFEEAVGAVGRRAHGGEDLGTAHRTPMGGPCKTVRGRRAMRQLFFCRGARWLTHSPVV